MIYRLYPSCVSHIPYSYMNLFYKIIINIKPLITFYGSSEWNLIYETYFNQPNLNHYDYMQCDLCKYEYCSKHQKIAPFDFYKCYKCNRNVSLCNWCKYIEISKLFCPVCMED